MKKSLQYLDASLIQPSTLTILLVNQLIQNLWHIASTRKLNSLDWRAMSIQKQTDTSETLSVSEMSVFYSISTQLIALVAYAVLEGLQIFF
jgi:hypothetical protein